MAIFIKYQPFVESKRIRTVEQPTKNGIDISSGSSTSQGVSVKNPLLANQYLMPFVNAGRSSNFIVDILNIDYSSPYDNTLPYDDKNKIDADIYLQDPSLYSNNTHFGDYLPSDGALEALEIRDVAKRTVYNNVVRHRMRGNPMLGNEDNKNGSDEISQFISDNINNDFVPFRDFVDRFGNINKLGTVLDPRLDKIEPFDENQLENRRANSNNSDINDALLAMTGSIDDGLIPRGYISSVAGFIYSGSTYGTDSIAFGGFLK